MDETLTARFEAHEARIETVLKQCAQLRAELEDAHYSPSSSDQIEELRRQMRAQDEAHTKGLRRLAAKLEALAQATPRRTDHGLTPVGARRGRSPAKKDSGRAAGSRRDGSPATVLSDISHASQRLAAATELLLERSAPDIETRIKEAQQTAERRRGSHSRDRTSRMRSGSRDTYMSEGSCQQGSCTPNVNAHQTGWRLEQQAQAFSSPPTASGPYLQLPAYQPAFPPRQEDWPNSGMAVHVVPYPETQVPPTSPDSCAHYGVMTPAMPRRDTQTMPTAWVEAPAQPHLHTNWHMAVIGPDADYDEGAYGTQRRRANRWR